MKVLEKGIIGSKKKNYLSGPSDWLNQYFRKVHNAEFTNRLTVPSDVGNDLGNLVNL